MGSCTFDARSDALRSTYYTQSASGQTEQFWQTYHYDAAGREVGDDYATCYNAGSGCTTSTVTSVRTYDADSHTTSQTVPPGFQPGDPTIYENGNMPFSNTSTVTKGYTWGPDAHLAGLQGLLFSVPGSSASYVWDGGDILLEQQNYSGTPYAYINIEKLGFITPFGHVPSGQINVYDRDWTGTAASDHSDKGFDVWNVDPQQWTPAEKLCQRQGLGCTTGTFMYSPPGTALSAARADGYTDTLNTFQGVRAYDSNSAQWTSPDAYAGDVHDPMSQKPYMWNRNNPIAYSDPSGYCIEDLCIVETLVGGALLLTRQAALHGGEITEAAAHPGGGATAGAAEGALESVAERGIAGRGENAAAMFGREMHEAFPASLGGDFAKGSIRLQSGRMRFADAVNGTQDLVLELKSTAPGSIRKGLSQARSYAEELKEITGRDVQYEVRTYNRDGSYNPLPAASGSTAHVTY